jgi:hypothetical protein
MSRAPNCLEAHGGEKKAKKSFDKHLLPGVNTL